jgi:ribosomal protein L5
MVKDTVEETKTAIRIHLAVLSYGMDHSFHSTTTCEERIEKLNNHISGLKMELTTARKSMHADIWMAIAYLKQEIIDELTA